MPRREDNRRKRTDDAAKNDNIVEKLIAVNRVSKSTKGGRTISFAALMVVGDRNGSVGFGLGKANDVSEAIKKATQKARKSMKRISLKKIYNPESESYNVTLPHEILGKYKSASVLLRPATAGTGVIAGGSVRAVCDAAGITDILSKSLGSNNKSNVIKAAISGLESLLDANELSINRGLSKKEMWG